MKINRRFLTPDEVMVDIFSEHIYIARMTGQGKMEMKKTSMMTVKALHQALEDERSIFVELNEDIEDES